MFRFVRCCRLLGFLCVVLGMACGSGGERENPKAREPGIKDESSLVLWKKIVPEEADYFQKYLIHDSRLYAVGNHSVFQFDREGRLLRKIGGRGEGPGEFLYISDAFIDDTVLVVVSSRGKTASFDLNGTLIHSRKYTLQSASVERMFRLGNRDLMIQNRYEKEEGGTFSLKTDLYLPDTGRILCSFPDETRINPIHYSGRRMKGPWFVAPLSNRMVPVISHEGRLYIFFSRSKKFHVISGETIQTQTIDHCFQRIRVTRKDRVEFYGQMQRANRMRITPEMKKEIRFPEYRELFAGVFAWNRCFALVQPRCFVLIDHEGRFVDTILHPPGISLDSQIQRRFADQKLIVQSDRLYFFDDDNECLKIFQIPPSRVYSR